MIVSYLKKWAKTNRIAAVDSLGRGFSFKELDSRSDALACELSKTLNPGEVVLIRGDKENDLLSCFYACIKAGNPYIFVPDFYPEDKIRKVLLAGKANLVLTMGEVPDFFFDVPVWNEKKIKAVASSEEIYKAPRKYEPEDLITIYFTSGSTGVPKGVAICYDNICEILETSEGWVSEDINNPRALNFFSYAFSASSTCVFGYLLGYGTTLYAVDRSEAEDSKKLLDSVYRIQPHYLDATPSFFMSCMSDPEFCQQTVPTLQAISTGGEPLTPNIARMILSRFPKATFYNCYGATETTGGFIFVEINEKVLDLGGALPIGRTFVGDDTVLIVDENRNPVQNGCEGELVAVSRFVSMGYYNEPDRTALSFAKSADGTRMYYTGDIVRRDENGYIFFVGRSGNMVKIGGYRVELEEVELHLLEIGGVRECAVVPVYDGTRAIMLAAFLVVHDNCVKGLTTTVQIKKKLAEKIPGYMVPQKILYIDAIPHNANGKIDRGVLISQAKIKH